MQYYFTVRCYTSTVYCIVVCLCVCNSLYCIGRLNLGSCKQYHTIAQALEFSDAKDLGKIQTDHSKWGQLMQVR